MMSRYNRQELLSFVGKKGQLHLLKSSAAVIGMGALGTAAAEILARAGVGKLVITDRDVVELTDLQRQLLYDESDVGRPKALAAAEKLKRINSEIKIVGAAADVDYKSVEKLVGKPDVVLDCTDNLETRFLLNEYCLKNKISWVHAAAIRETAQMMAFDFRKRTEKSRQACFACVFGSSAAAETCDTVGVLASATIAIAAMQATEAIKILTGMPAATSMLRLNVLRNELTKIAVKRNPNCKSCVTPLRKRSIGKLICHDYDYLKGKKAKRAVVMCGRGTYQIKGEAVNIEKLKSQLQRMGEEVADFGECISLRNITLFKDGRAIIKADSGKAAKSAYSRLASM